MSNVRPGSRFDGRVGKLAWEALREKLAEAMTHAGRDGEGYTWLACHEVEHHLDEGARTTHSWCGTWQGQRNAWSSRLSDWQSR